MEEKIDAPVVMSITNDVLIHPDSIDNMKLLKNRGYTDDEILDREQLTRLVKTVYAISIINLHLPISFEYSSTDEDGYLKNVNHVLTILDTSIQSNEQDESLTVTFSFRLMCPIDNEVVTVFGIVNSAYKSELPHADEIDDLTRQVASRITV